MSKTITIILLLLLFAIFGAFNTIILKHLYNEKGKNINFSHNWFILILMYFAEMLGIPLYYIIKYITKKKEIQEDLEIKDIVLFSIEPKPEIKEQLSKTKKIFLLGYPFIFDLIISSIELFCLIIFPASIYKMLKGVIVIIITFLISKFYLKNEHNLDQYVSLIISVIGLILTGISTFLGEKNNYFDDNNINISLIIISFILFLIQMFFHAAFFSIEEYYMKKYSFHPFLFIGMQGLFGFIFNIILCIIFYYIKCGSDPSDFLKNLCTKDGNDIWRIENVIFAFEQIFDNHKILIYVIVLTISLFVFNMFGISIIKTGGATARALVDNATSLFVWIYFLLPFVNDELKESFNWIRLIGLILIFGNIIIYLGVLRLEERRRIRRQLKVTTDLDKLYHNLDGGQNEDIISLTET